MREEQHERWRRLSPYLDAALELDEDARIAWLKELDAREPAIAADVRSLLAERNKSDDQPLFSADPTTGLSRGDLAGQQLGAYTIDCVLGHGGMGTVWLAHRSDGRFDGSVAVKLLSAALIGRPAEQRFVREGSLLAKLRHPHIAQLIDAGVAPGGQPYLVLEYVEGEHIDHYCQRRNLSIDEGVRLFLDVLAAVTHAHSRLIVHRDLKPSNILVTTTGVVKLLDFGVAALLRPDDPALTREADRGLTPGYAAPEQLLGAPVTTAADVYALGLVLCVLLTGRHPLARGVESATQFARATLDDDPPSASQLAADTQRGRALRGDLDNIVAKALKKNPEERYPTAEAFAQDLRRFLACQPVTARPDSLAYRAGKFVRRHRGGVTGALLTVLALVGGLAGTAWQAHEARLQREEAIAQATKAEASRRFLNLMVSEIGDGSTSVTPLQLLDQGMVLLEEQYGRDPRFMAGELLQMANRYAAFEQFARRKELLQRAEALARSQNDANLLTEALCDLGLAELDSGDRDAAQRRMDEAIRLLATMDRPAPLIRAYCLSTSAHLLDAKGETRPAIQTSHELLELLQAVNQADHPLYSVGLTRLSKLHDDLGERAAAFEFNRRAGEAMDRAGLGGTVNRMIVFTNEAVDLRNYGEVATAEKLLASVLARIAARGGAATRASNVETNHGAVLAMLARSDEALATLGGAIERARAMQNPFWEQRARFFRARALIGAERWSEAAAELDHVEAWYRRDPAANLPFLQSIAVTRVELHLRSGRAVEADRMMQSLLAGIGYPDQPFPAVLNPALPLAAEIALTLGDAARAETFAAAAVDVAEKAARDANHSADVGRARLILGKAQAAQGDVAAARLTIAAALPGLTYGLGAEHPLTREAQRLNDEANALRQAVLQ